MRLTHIDQHQLRPFLLHFAGELFSADFGTVIRGLRADSAERLIVDQLSDARLLAAHRAGGILAQLELAEPELQGIEQQKSPDQRVARADDPLDRLQCLNAPDDAGQNPQYPSLSTARNQSRRGWLGVQAPIARTLTGIEDRRLTFEAEDAAVHVRLSE